MVRGNGERCAVALDTRVGASEGRGISSILPLTPFSSTAPLPRPNGVEDRYDSATNPLLGHGQQKLNARTGALLLSIVFATKTKEIIMTIGKTRRTLLAFVKLHLCLSLAHLSLEFDLQVRVDQSGAVG